MNPRMGNAGQSVMSQHLTTGCWRSLLTSWRNVCMAFHTPWSLTASMAILRLSMCRRYASFWASSACGILSTRFTEIVASAVESISQPISVAKAFHCCSNTGERMFTCLALNLPPSSANCFGCGNNTLSAMIRQGTKLPQTAIKVKMKVRLNFFMTSTIYYKICVLK